MIFSLTFVLSIGYVYLRKDIKEPSQINLDELEARVDKLHARLLEDIDHIVNANIYYKRLSDINNKVSRSGDRITLPKIHSLDLTTKSNVTAYELDRYFESSGYPLLEGTGKYFIEAENDYKINAIFLVALSIQESGGGNAGKYAKERNNFFGYGANTSNPNNAHYFSTKEEAIKTVGRKISENYLSPNGKYNRGTTLEGVHTLYCTTPGWSSAIGTIMLRISDKISKMDIPVMEKTAYKAE